MQISEIRIRKVTAEGKLKAYVTITFDGCFVIHNVKIIEGKTGLFIAMPSRKAAGGEYRDTAHPINSATREKMQKLILEKYEAAMEEAVEE
jgi:stage V sporulation protein G